MFLTPLTPKNLPQKATTPPARLAAPVVPPHAGSGPLTLAQLRRARVRIAVEMLTPVVENLEACPAPVRQAAWTALAAVVELQALLTEQRSP